MHNDIFSLKDKVAVVAGGAGGIGGSLAAALCRYGAKVIIADYNVDKFKEVADAIASETNGCDVDTVFFDITSEDSITKMFQTVADKYGKIDILINSAGILNKYESLSFPMEEWDRIFAINVKGTMMTSKAVAPYMIKNGGGCIVNLSSVRGTKGFTGGNAAYCASKAGVELITKTLALEWAPYNIRVNAMGPSLVVTSATKWFFDDPELSKRRAAAIPLGRIAVPEDLAGACIFLVSEASSFITGQTIFVDGGVSACEACALS